MYPIDTDLTSITNYDDYLESRKPLHNFGILLILDEFEEIMDMFNEQNFY